MFSIENKFIDQDLLIRNIHKYDYHLMELCVDVAKKSNMRSKHGCVVVDNRGKIISSACNKRTNLKDEHIDEVLLRQRKGFSTHAEESALKNVDRNRLKGAKLYVVRWGYAKNCPFHFLNSKPCVKCTAIINACINNYGLKGAYYSTDIGDILSV